MTTTEITNRIEAALRIASEAQAVAFAAWNDGNVEAGKAADITRGAVGACINARYEASKARTEARAEALAAKAERAAERAAKAAAKI